MPTCISAGGGARGSSGKVNPNSALMPNSEPIEVTNEKSRSSGGIWKRSNFEATEESDGVLILGRPNYEYEQVNNNTTAAKAKIKAGYVNTSNGSMNGYWTGIDWDKVTEVKGDTYDIKGKIKEKGFVWNRDTKSWVKKSK